MSNHDPLSVDALMRWLRVEDDDERPDIEQLIEAGKSRAKTLISYDYDSGGERTQYIDGQPSRVDLPSDDVSWTLDIHENGQWVRQSAEQSGDILCVTPDCGFSCDCNSCGDKPRLRLRTKPAGLVNQDVVTYVRKYVTYNYQNRGDCEDAAKMAAIDAILRPYMRIVFA